ncbi:MAG: 30S ribosomal protein S17 [Acidobacteriota bacterium]|nr:30S ribosomal protein S17 [Acidobacteriota bacterium]MDE2711304.1 30S ribosomal protein S17 [Acidobacteriota bacterium]MXW72485.1 30S ribosomal protein S17 [Acidobacteriota bacterium]MXX87400.1 30S ribosomal protein S17 [Acidobacteriota bacterium]MYE44906.1 30S ribosomal protein S17 [Acidobacteriota bacterium]
MPRLIRTGTVVASGAEKTITVLVERLVEHRLYKRRFRKSTRFAVHDEKNEGRIGDRVQIEECRPLSRTKRFRLLKVVERAT